MIVVTNLKKTIPVAAKKKTIQKKDDKNDCELYRK